MKQQHTSRFLIPTSLLRQGFIGQVAGIILGTVCFPALAAPTLPPETCRMLVAHEPDADVNYQPDRRVELHPSPINPPDKIQIPITANLLNYLKLDPNKAPAKALNDSQIPLGTLTYKNRQLFWNGKPLQDEQKTRLLTICN